jgi:hypothetical protein
VLFVNLHFIEEFPSWSHEIFFSRIQNTSHRIEPAAGDSGRICSVWFRMLAGRGFAFHAVGWLFDLRMSSAQLVFEMSVLQRWQTPLEVGAMNTEKGHSVGYRKIGREQ